MPQPATIKVESVTFHHQAARAARCPEVVGGHAGVTSRVRLGDVDDPQAPVIQNSDSAKTAHTGGSVWFFFLNPT